MSIQRLFRRLALAACLLGSGMVQAVPPLAVDRHYDVPFNAPADLFLAGVNPNSDGSDPRVYFEPVTPPMHGNVVFGTLNGVIYTPHKGYSGPDSFTFRVSHPVHGYSNIATASLTVGQTFDLQPKRTDGSVASGVSYTSTNTGVATVSSAGVITVNYEVVG